MHKPNNSQLPPNVGGPDGTTGLIPTSAISTAKHTNKVGSLKNKAAFEKFHPSQTLTETHGSDFSPSKTTKPGSALQNNTNTVL